MIEPPPAYDRRNEYENRNRIDAELAQKYDKRTDLVVPYGKTLKFNGASGNLVAFGYTGGEFEISVDGAAGTSIATTASVTAVDDKLTASYAMTVDVNGKIAQVKLLSDGTTSTLAFTATTFKIFDDSSTNVAPFEVTGGAVKIKTANVGVLTAANISVANLAAISANMGAITSGSIDLTSGSYVAYHGAGFGVSSDLILWYGLASTARGSATKTNGVFALATDGKVYHNTAELSSPVKLSFSAAINDVSSPFTGTITVTATGGAGGYTYLWYKGPDEAGISASFSATTTATVTISASLGAGDDSTGRAYVVVTDSAGSTAIGSQAYNFSDPS